MSDEPFLVDCLRMMQKSFLEGEKAPHSGRDRVSVERVVGKVSRRWWGVPSSYSTGNTFNEDTNNRGEYLQSRTDRVFLIDLTSTSTQPPSVEVHKRSSNGKLSEAQANEKDASPSLTIEALSCTVLHHHCHSALEGAVREREMNQKNKRTFVNLLPSDHAYLFAAVSIKS